MESIATGTTTGWQLVSPGSPLERRDTTRPALADGWALVKVAACGLCHTDIGFLNGSVKPRHELPLTLGHEISGVVEDTGPDTPIAQGTRVIVPAVLPCGACDLCRRERENACQQQIMPGNHLHGGFATHVAVPARYLVPVDPIPDGHDLEDLSVIADAISTPYQAVVKAGVSAGDFSIFIGVGGIGGFGVQVAHALGARVAALDIDDARLETLSRHGADFTLDVKGRNPREIRQAIRDFAKSEDLPPHGWKIFETSGTAAGQTLAFSLLNHTATLAIVGFTMDKVEVRLSNLMAFDANAFGTWGARPAVYADVLALVRAKRIALKPFIRRYPMSELNDLVERAHKGELRERPVLIPDF